MSLITPLNTKRLTSLVSLLLFVFSSNTYSATTDKPTGSINSPIVSEKQNLSDDNAQTDAQNVLSLLIEMKKAILEKDYQFNFLSTNQNQSSPATYKYQHINRDGQHSANLLSLEGSAREIILHDKTISYFQSESMPFSMSGSYILEVFPELVYNDFNALSQYYDFVLLGKSRTANRSSQLVRIVPKDKDRFNYLIWIDDKTNLPLRIDLFDLDFKMLEQMKVVELKLDFDKKKFEDYIKDRDYPILFPNEKENSDLNHWAVSWLPKGFKESAAYNIYFNASNIDTQLFSDGIFSFTVSVSEKSNETSSHIITQGSTTIYSGNIGNMNIVVIGNLPPETIEKIAQSVKLK